MQQQNNTHPNTNTNTNTNTNIWEEIIANNRLETDKNQKIIQQVLETQKRALQTQKNIKNTLDQVQSTISTIQSTTQKIQKFEKDYNHVMDKLAQKISQSIGAQLVSQIDPIVLPIKQVLDDVIKYNKILFLTGSGISAASGIPTFRGAGGYWTRFIQEEEEVFEAKQLLTNRFYQKHPELVWKWHQQFYDLCLKSKPNNAHNVLEKICNSLSDNGKQVTLATQNLDNLQPHNAKFKFHHIHGDIEYIRCENKQMHLSPFSTSHSNCSQCNYKMRPHTLFFDEPYQHHYGGAIMNNQYDVVFAIGTMVQTNLARRLVREAKVVVQINPTPVLKNGRVYTIAKTAEQALTEIYSHLNH